MNVVAYNIRVRQFSVALSTFRSVGYGKDIKFSNFSVHAKKVHVALHRFELFFFYFGGNFMSYLVVLVATGTQDG